MAFIQSIELEIVLIMHNVLFTNYKILSMAMQALQKGKCFVELNQSSSSNLSHL